MKRRRDIKRCKSFLLHVNDGHFESENCSAKIAEQLRDLLPPSPL